MFRLRLQRIPCTIVIFGMFSGQRSTLGNGLSGRVLDTFRPAFVKVTGAAQSDFGLVQLQVNRKLLLNWMYHTAGPVQLMEPKFPCGQLNRHVRWHKQAGNVQCGHWECLYDYSCGCARFDTIVSHFNVVECCIVHPDTRLAKFNGVVHNEGTRRESWDFCCVCSMPCCSQWMGDEVKLSKRQPVAILQLVRHERWP